MNQLRTAATLAASALSVALLLALLPSSRAQTQTPPPQRPAQQDEDVERVTSALVQTDVTVHDRDGRFVDNLTREQFQLKVDGQPQSIAFFERVVAGSADEPAQIASAASSGTTRAASSTSPAPSGANSTGAPASAADAARGRTVFFFVDDFHLDSESFIRARRAVLRAVETELAPNDRAAVVTAGGNIATPVLTTDRAALRAAVERMGQRSGLFRDNDRPQMSEYQALAVSREDRAMINFYAEYLVTQRIELTREAAEASVKSRAYRILEASAPLAVGTLTALEQVVRAAAQSPGRKLIFFISDGFLVESDRANSYANLRRVTDAAAREGVLVYTLNARGLVSNTPGPDEPGTLRPSATNVIGDNSVQDALYTLAADTGGRALVNSNDMNAGVRRAMQETAVYYLIAWNPPRSAEADPRFKRIEVSVVGRPDLRVRTRRNLAASLSTSLARVSSPAPAAVSPAEELLGSLANAAAAQQGLPATLAVAFRDAPDGRNFTLTASVQVAPPAAPAGQPAALDFAALVLDAQGKRVAASGKRVPLVEGARGQQQFYNLTADLPPGRYQVRAAARDSATGRTGTASQEVEIPDLSAGRFHISSLLLSEQADVGEQAGAPRGVARRFSQTSRLRFLAYAYNAAPDPANDNTPDLDIKLQVTRRGQPVAVPPLIEVLIEDEDETKRFPVAAEFPLDDFEPGEYTLQLTVTDRLKKTAATQQAPFVVVE